MGLLSDEADLQLALAVYEAAGGAPDDWRRGQKVSVIQIAIRDGRDGVLAPPSQRRSVGSDLHHFSPDRKFPWFCIECGYGRRERLRHFQNEEA